MSEPRAAAPRRRGAANYLTPDDIDVILRWADLERNQGNLAAAAWILTQLRSSAVRTYGASHRHLKPVNAALQTLRDDNPGDAEVSRIIPALHGGEGDSRG